MRSARISDAPASARFRVNVCLRQHLRRVHFQRLRENCVRQRLEALFLRDGRAGAALGLVGPVEVLDLSQRRRLVDGLRQLLRQLFLRGDGGLDLLAPLGKIAQILEPCFERPKRCVVHCAVLLLAVAGDERNGVAFVQKGNDVFNIFLLAV